MELTIKNNREIYPQKVATKQGEAQTTVLKFTRDSYKYDQIDLRNYTAYAVTSFNGEIDMTQLTMTTSGSELIITWSLSERILRYAGAIVYQIVFKGEKDSPAVFSTYQGIIQNSESIDNTISSDYPTIMKQWLDLINARSGAVPHKIVYMYPGESIPVEERTAGTLYYQWEEAHTTSAVSATGQVDLGHSPHADSGLYINGTHVYVDDSSDTVYVLEPSVWVDAINAANCGVTASDISNGDGVVILLTASTAGAAGNNITYELGLAQYGGGKGVINPSNGTTQGATLTGGYDEQTGVDRPQGHFEDHFGNTLSRIDRGIDDYCTLPDYSSKVDVMSTITSGITMPCDAWLHVRSGNGDGGDGKYGIYLSVNGTEVMSVRGYDYGHPDLFVPVRKGDLISVRIVGGLYEATYYPMVSK